jgi:hypothetical protein
LNVWPSTRLTRGRPRRGWRRSSVLTCGPEWTPRASRGWRVGHRARLRNCPSPARARPSPRRSKCTRSAG